METIITRVNNTADKTFDEWLTEGRRYWKARPERVIRCDGLLVLDATNTVRAAGQVEGVLKDLDKGSGRVEILVRPQPKNEWLGKTIIRPDTRNPVTYLTEIQEAN